VNRSLKLMLRNCSSETASPSKIYAIMCLIFQVMLTNTKCRLNISRLSSEILVMPDLNLRESDSFFTHLLYIICRICNKCICSISTGSWISYAQWRNSHTLFFHLGIILWPCRSSSG
jgi:hypothetical protein